MSNRDFKKGKIPRILVFAVTFLVIIAYQTSRIPNAFGEITDSEEVSLVQLQELCELFLKPGYTNEEHAKLLEIRDIFIKSDNLDFDKLSSMIKSSTNLMFHETVVYIMNSRKERRSQEILIQILMNSPSLRACTLASSGLQRRNAVNPLETINLTNLQFEKILSRAQEGSLVSALPFLKILPLLNESRQQKALQAVLFRFYTEIDRESHPSNPYAVQGARAYNIGQVVSLFYEFGDMAHDILSDALTSVSETGENERITWLRIALAISGDTDAYSLLGEIATNARDPQIRFVAIDAMSTIGDTIFIPVLIKAMNDSAISQNAQNSRDGSSIPFVALNARKALEKLGQTVPSEEELVRRLSL